ncbi:MAG: hypothetical protein JSS96_13865 [Bacteroidetes bacterium]|nr:hypothetical protein [Bacteroidota bacterium]
MNSLKQRLLTNWHVARITRAVLGLLVLIMGIQMHDWSAGLISLVFIYMAVTNTGCCGVQECYTPARKDKDTLQQNTNEIDYEEVK